jgi:predicted nucleotidyltransferase
MVHKLHPIIENKIYQLEVLCRKYKVEKLYAFGSVISSHFNPETSDIDLIAELEKLAPIEKGENLMNLWTELEELFTRKIDLLSDQPIKNPFLRKNIEQTKQLIYDRRSEKVSV